MAISRDDKPKVASSEADVAEAIHCEKNEIPNTSRDVPSEDELENLRHIADVMPSGVWLVAALVVFERFVYFGLTTPLQNYMQNPPNSGIPGALGLGQSTATRLWYFLAFLSFLSPTLGAMIADGWLGRYKTLLAASGVYISGALILFLTSLPASLKHGAGFGGLIAAMIFLGSGSGAFKSSISAFIGEQYTETEMRLELLASGEKVIRDPKLTIQSIYNIYFWSVNVGCLAIIPVTILEKSVGFWAAYLLPLCVMCMLIVVLVLGSKVFVIREPDGTILSKTFKVAGYAIVGRFNMDSARPSALGKPVPWDDDFIDEMKLALVACRVFLTFPVLCLCQAQLSSNLVSMAASMETHNIPNDLMMMCNPISIIVLLPVVDRLVYPLLRRHGIHPQPVTRMTFGFLMESMSMGYAAVVQHLVYSAGPCYSFPRACPASPGGKIPNRVNVFIQVPVYFIEGFGEMFCSTAGYEYAFTKAPASMKSMIQAIFILTATVGTMLGWALTPLYQDPRLVIMYSVLAAMMGTVMVLGWIFLSKYNKKEYETHAGTTKPKG